MTPLLASLWMPDAATMRLILPELMLVATLVVLLVAPLLVGRSARLTGLLALIGAAVAAISALATFKLTPEAIALFTVDTPDTAMLVADKLGLYFRVFLMVFLLGVTAMWFWFDAQRTRHAPEFFTLLVASALGMALMVSTVNLLLMVIAIELASMPSYALAGFDRHRKLSAEASLKYVIFGAVTSGLMIYGVSLLYGLYGTLHIPSLVTAVAQAGAGAALSPLLVVALLAVFAGIAFKISAVPFHFWCPDVFEGAPLPVTTWLSVASKAAGLVLLLRLVGAFTASQSAGMERLLPVLSYGIGFFAMLTCTFANVAAYRQRNVRRMLAYSSIAHAGYMLAAGAMVLQDPRLSAAVMGAVITYLLMYMFMNFGAFVTLGLVAADTGSEDLEAFTGLGWRDPATAASLTLCLVSLVGLPPMGGFIAKWWLIWSLGDAAQAAGGPLSTWLWIIVLVIALNTAISLYYYARVIRQMYLRGTKVTGATLRAPLSGKLALHVCALVLLAAGTVMVGSLKNMTDGVVGPTPPAAAAQAWPTDQADMQP